MIHGNVIHRLKSMSNVRSILADSRISFGNNDYRGMCLLCVNLHQGCFLSCFKFSSLIGLLTHDFKKGSLYSLYTSHFLKYNNLWNTIFLCATFQSTYLSKAEPRLNAFDAKRVYKENKKM
ncbi:hypothetical protein Hanom_Chr04g00353051 [Helianthus anomalus]